MEMKQKIESYRKVTDYTTSHTELINDQKKIDRYQQRYQKSRTEQPALMT